jgi:O-antigen/teichoic acid export membrane protein
MNKKLLILTLGRIAQMAILFVTYRVLSHMLSVGDMGVYYFLLSISAGFGLIFANPLGVYSYRMLHSWQTHGVINKNLRSLTFILFSGSLLTVPFLFIFKDKLSVDKSSPLMVLLTLVLYVFSSSLNGSIVPVLNLLGHYTSFVILSFLTSLIGLVLSAFLVNLHPSQPLYWLIGQALAFIVFSFIAILLIAKNNAHTERPRTVVPAERFKRVVTFAAPIVITNLAVWTLAQGYRFFFKGNVDSIELGELTFGMGLATSLSVAVEYLFQQLFLPDFYKKIHEPKTDKSKIWNELFDNLMPSYLFVIVFMIGLSPFIMRILADIKFVNAGRYLALGAVVELCRMSGNVFNMATQSEMQTHKAIGPYLTGGFVTLIGVLFVSHQSQFIYLTPYLLMLGQLIALVLLWRSVQKMFTVKIAFPHLIKSLLISVIFLSAMFLKSYSGDLIISLAITAAYGIFLTILLYKNFIGSKANA